MRGWTERISPCQSSFSIVDAERAMLASNQCCLSDIRDAPLHHDLDITLTPVAEAPEGLEDATREALQSIPAIQEALTTGGFKIKLARSYQRPNQSHTVKRQLRDARTRSRDSTHAPVP